MDGDLLFDEDLLAEASLEKNVETDDQKIVRWTKAITEITISSDLHDFVAQSLPVTGQRFGTSLSMNRAIAYLKSEKFLEDKCPTWASCKRENKDTVAASFALVLPATNHFLKLKKAILEGFLPKKTVAVKKITHQPLILEEVDENSLVQQGGRPVDRAALLACALADPEFIAKFTELSAPIDAALRPAMLDQGAPHVILARWTIVAEEINARRELYSNVFADLEIKGYGRVLENIQPAKGIFYSTSSLPMGKQLKQLLTKMRNANMLLNERVNKSGDNSAEDELILCAYIRTGLILELFFSIVASPHNLIIQFLLRITIFCSNVSCYFIQIV